MHRLATLWFASALLAGCGAGSVNGGSTPAQLLSESPSGPLWNAVSVLNTCEAMNPAACPSLTVDNSGRYTAGALSGNINSAELVQLDQDLNAVVQAINVQSGPCEKVQDSVPGSSTRLDITMPDGKKYSIVAAGMGLAGQCNPAGTTRLATTLATLEAKYFH